MRVYFSPLARRDADKAEFDLAKVGYDVEFTNELDQAIRRIGEDPRTYPRTEDGPDGVETREYYIRRFKYRVIYSFASDDAVEIVGVIYAHRRPESWVHRLKDDPGE